jgi:hypothetical protein
MKVLITKVLALGGLCALLVGAGNTAFAQGYDRNDHHDMGYDHRDMGRDNRSMVFGTRQRIQELQRSYAHNMHMGNYAAARRAHLRAEELRSHLRGHRDFGG